ncbi:MAG: hypothetical protein R6W78_13755 [Bacteroidales bacterium]
MKTFYSILSLNINPGINERLSVGMLMIFGEKVFFHYSKHKLSVLLKLIDKTTYKAALDYLKLIEKSVSGNENILSKELLELKSENKYSQIFSERYIEYLSRYNNNLISFSKPKFLEIDATENIFRKLFVKLIDESAFETVEKKDGQIDRFKKQFYPKAEQFFNIEQEIDSTIFTGLLTPIKIDLLGKNKIEVFAQSIDFEKPIRYIESDIGSLLQINRALPKAKQFVMGYEPDTNMQVNHLTWNNIKNFPDFEYIDISDAEKITDYAVTHGVKPLFD